MASPQVLGLLLSQPERGSSGQSRRGKQHAVADAKMKNEVQSGVVEAGCLSWPPRLRHELMRPGSVCGLLPKLNRAYVAIADGTVFLWNIVSGDFAQFDSPLEHPVTEMIDVDLAEYDPTVSQGLIIVSAKSLCVVGLRDERARLQIVDRGMCFDLEQQASRLIQHPKTKRIFAAGASGVVLEVEIDKKTLSVSPHSNASLLEKLVPGAFLPVKAPVIDVAIDSTYLYSLTSAGDITMWSAGEDSSSRTLKHIQTVKHNGASFPRSADGAAASSSPLVRLFVTKGTARGASTALAAISSNGDMFTYEPSFCFSESSTASSVRKLEPREYVPTALGTRLRGAVAAQDVCILDDGHQTLATACPHFAMPPMSARDTETTFMRNSPSPWAAVAVWRSGKDYPETVEQLRSPRRSFVVLTESGAQVFVRLWASDMVHAAHLKDQNVALDVPLSRDESCAALIGLAAGMPKIKCPLQQAAERASGASRLLEVLDAGADASLRHFAVQQLLRFTDPVCDTSRNTVTMSPFVKVVGDVLHQIVVPVMKSPLLDPKKGSWVGSHSQIQRSAQCVRYLREFCEQVHGQLWGSTTNDGHLFEFIDKQTARCVPGNSPQSVAPQAQNTRMAELVRTMAIAEQALRFIEFVGGVANPVLSKACRSNRELYNMQLRTFLEEPKKARAVASALLSVVIDAGNSGELPDYDAWMTLFAQTEAVCPLLFSTADSLARESLVRLARAKDSAEPSRFRDVIITVADQLRPIISSIEESGSLKQIATLICEMNAFDVAVHLWMAAASRITEPGRSGTCVSEAIVILEAVWRSSAEGFSMLLSKTSPLWCTDPNDRRSHERVFDWMLAPRKDATLSSSLKQAFAECGSKWVEHYCNNSPVVDNFTRALVLRDGKGDMEAAADAFFASATGPMTQCPASECIVRRLRHLHAARACVIGLPQAESISTLLHQLELQAELADIIQTFTQSNSPALELVVELDGEPTTQMRAAIDQLARVRESVLEPEEIFRVAEMYRAIGGLDVQLKLLMSQNVTDFEVVKDVIDGAFLCSPSPLTVARSAVRHCGVSAPFEILVARLLEANVPVDAVVGVFASVPGALATAAFREVAEHAAGTTLNPAIVGVTFTKATAISAYQLAMNLCDLIPGERESHRKNLARLS